VRNLEQQVNEIRKQPGPPGEPATKLFGYIRDNGPTDTANVVYGSGVTAVSDPPGNSDYVVTFNRSLANCVVQATNGFGNPTGGSAAVDTTIPIVSSMGAGNPGNVLMTFDKGGALADTSFLITAFC
jgi:hypothetical protein